MTDFNQLLQERLQQRRDQQRYRSRHSRQTPQGPLVTIGDREMINFSGNDYLGLANHPKVIESLRAAASKAGVGSGASHLVYGHSDHHHQLELALAEFTGRERALLLSTGYMANLGVIAALVARNDTVFQDRLNHASLIDGGLLSRAQLKRFRHNDTEQLKNQLASTEQGLKLVVVDGVFSMDGDLAPLPELASICQAHQGLLMVDDAHGFGVLGSQGGGCAQHFQLSPAQLPVLVGTLGKSFGTFGAFVAGSELLIENLIQFARPYIYTTALPPALCAATLTSLGLMKQENWRRLKLAKLIAQFRSGAQAMGLPLMETFTPIQPVVLGEDDILLEVAAKLKAANILVGAIRPPTVPEGSARLRITLSAAHSEEQVAQLLKVLDGSVPLSRRQ